MTFKPLDWQFNSNYPQRDPFIDKIALAIDGNSITPIWEQLEANIGWEPIPPEAGFQFNADESLGIVDMPPVMPMATALHALECIYIYPAGFVLILQLDGSYSLCRYLGV